MKVRLGLLLLALALAGGWLAKGAGPTGRGDTSRASRAVAILPTAFTPGPPPAFVSPGAGLTPPDTVMETTVVSTSGAKAKSVPSSASSPYPDKVSAPGSITSAPVTAGDVVAPRDPASTSPPPATAPPAAPMTASTGSGPPPTQPTGDREALKPRPLDSEAYARDKQNPDWEALNARNIPTANVPRPDGG